MVYKRRDIFQKIIEINFIVVEDVHPTIIKALSKN